MVLIGELPQSGSLWPSYGFPDVDFQPARVPFAGLLAAVKERLDYLQGLGIFSSIRIWNPDPMVDYIYINYADIASMLDNPNMRTYGYIASLIDWAINELCHYFLSYRGEISTQDAIDPLIFDVASRKFMTWDMDALITAAAAMTDTPPIGYNGVKYLYRQQSGNYYFKDIALVPTVARVLDRRWALQRYAMLNLLRYPAAEIDIGNFSSKYRYIAVQFDSRYPNESTDDYWTRAFAALNTSRDNTQWQQRQSAGHTIATMTHHTYSQKDTLTLSEYEQYEYSPLDGLSPMSRYSIFDISDSDISYNDTACKFNAGFVFGFNQRYYGDSGGVVFSPAMESISTPCTEAEINQVFTKTMYMHYSSPLWMFFDLAAKLRFYDNLEEFI